MLNKLYEKLEFVLVHLIFGPFYLVMWAAVKILSKPQRVASFTNTFLTVCTYLILATIFLSPYLLGGWVVGRILVDLDKIAGR